MALDVTDKTANGNDFTNINGVAEETGDLPFVESTVAADFEFSSSQYLKINDNASISPTNDLSIGFWVNLESTPGAGVNMDLVWKNLGAGNQFSYSVTIVRTGGPVFTMTFIWSGNGSSTSSEKVNTKITSGADVGTWVHWMITLDSSAKDAIWYRDGSSVASTLTDGGHTSIFDSSAPLALGADDNGGAPRFFLDGLFDEFTLFDDVRSPTEVSDNFDSLLTGSEDNLQVYLPFETLPVAAVAAAGKGLNFDGGPAAIG